MFIVRRGAKVLICSFSTANGSSSGTEIGSSCTLAAPALRTESSHNCPAWYCFPASRTTGSRSPRVVEMSKRCE